MRSTTISPCLAYIRMLRASSEMTVAIRTWSVAENSSEAAMSRPARRAMTMSASVRIDVSLSLCMRARSDRGPAHGMLQVREPLLEVERRRDAREGESELHHRERDLGLDPDDDGRCTPQPDHVRDVAQRLGGEGVHHVEGRDVDDDSQGAEPADLRHEGVSQLEQVGVAESGLHRGDQERSLLEDRDLHEFGS